MSGAAGGSWRRAAAAAWPLLQQAAAATLAWWIARALGDHDDPFFAPVAAVVALNASRGDRGRNALRLLLGVLVGIVAGEVVLAALGGGYGSLALAVFAALVVARLLDEPRIVLAQAGAGAVLTVAVGTDSAGFYRVVDALVGAGVALLFSQLLFTPEPVALLRRAETAALDRMAAGLELTCDALERGDERLAERAMTALRAMRDGLADLARTRQASTSVIRYSIAWRFRTAPSARERENAGHLDLLGGSCLMLARTALAAGPDERALLAPALKEITAILHALAADPGDQAARQRATERVLEVVGGLNDSGLETEAAGRDAAAGLRAVAADLLVFAGVPAEYAVAAVREGAGRFEVPEPPRLPWPHRLARLRHPFHKSD
ncbi:aromatic acid exporter family protein [Actinomadura sp. 21ATH]|uniref:aromatic acid exporter family protein n=1 Tax=Actinomadura sp. 21ATH TaxID=1735444 RepID=UPI0035C14511